MTGSSPSPVGSTIVEMRPGNSVRQARILIVDDEKMSCRLLAGILEKQHFLNVEIVETGKAALKSMISFRPDLVLLDMQLPDIVGLEVCTRIRANPEFVDVPILIQTATVNRKEMGDLFAAGASDFLSKPINPAELVSRVIVHLERRLLLGEMREYRERISQELDAARRMQLEILPSPVHQEQLAASAGLRVGSYNRPSSEIGGDLWGLLPIDQGSFGLFLADFTGHGVTAALNTFRLHALIHEYKELHADPAEFVTMLNERLARLLPPDQFATFIYVLVAHGAGELRLTSAGAPSAIIQIGLLGAATLAETSGLPLGIAKGVRYGVHRLPFPPGSLLLLYSDGLSEFADKDGHRIGEAGLVTAINASHPELAPYELIDRLCDAAGITARQTLPDDTTIICIDRRVGSRELSRSGSLFVKAPTLDGSPAFITPLQPESAWRRC